MIPSESQCVVIGGGFYGSCVALYLRELGRQVIILERENELLTRASYANQARVHYGYHYPRSVATGVSCTLNFPRFTIDFSEAVVNQFTKIYAIARLNSRVTANQFAGYCDKIGAPYRSADRVASLFNSDLIESVFEVKEFAFNSTELKRILKARLKEAGVSIHTDCDVDRVSEERAGLRVDLRNRKEVRCQSVFNCTYASINEVLRRSGLPTLPLRYEIAEIALMRPPAELNQMGVTVMDGPFFSAMPFPARSLHSMSHVRYTPHLAWQETDDSRSRINPTDRQSRDSNFVPMIKDAQRYLPCLCRAEHVESLYETKAVLIENEGNDGRPILLRRNHGMPGLNVVMGGKIDNIYDVFCALDASTQAAA